MSILNTIIVIYSRKISKLYQLPTFHNHEHRKHLTNSIFNFFKKIKTSLRISHSDLSQQRCRCQTCTSSDARSSSRYLQTNKTPNLQKPFQIPFPNHPLGDPERTQKTKTKRKSNYQISLIKSKILQFFSSTKQWTILYSDSE